MYAIKRRNVGSMFHYGFIGSKNNPLIPQCLTCLRQLTSASMKPDKVSLHLYKCHASVENIPNECFETLGESVCFAFSKLKSFLIERNCTSRLTSLYNISLLISKQGRLLSKSYLRLGPHETAFMETHNVANIFYSETVLCNFPIYSNTVSYCIIDIADDVKAILFMTCDAANFHFPLINIPLRIRLYFLL